MVSVEPEMITEKLFDMEVRLPPPAPPPPPPPELPPLPLVELSVSIVKPIAVAVVDFPTPSVQLTDQV